MRASAHSSLRRRTSGSGASRAHGGSEAVENVAIRLADHTSTRRLLEMKRKLEGRASESLGNSASWASSRKTNWQLQLGSKYPALFVRDIQTRWEEAYLICELPDHIMLRTQSWGHTALFVHLVPDKVDNYTYCGVRCLDDTDKHIVRATISLAVVSPLLTILQVLLLSTTHQFGAAATGVLSTLVICMEAATVVVCVARRLRRLYRPWMVALVIVSALKLSGCISDFVLIISNTAEKCRSIIDEDANDELDSGETCVEDAHCLDVLSRRTWLRITSLIIGAFSLAIEVTLIWSARRLNRGVRAEEHRSRILISLERSDRVFSHKPILMWLSDPAIHKSRDIASSDASSERLSD